MREIDNFLHKESTKLYQLLRDVQENRKAQDKVWDDFCKKNVEDANKKKKKTNNKSFFKKHPKHLSSSSSEVLTPRRNEVAQVKSSKPPGLDTWKSESSSEAQEDSPVDVVTVREEISIIRNEYLGKVCGKMPAWGRGQPREIVKQVNGKLKNNEAVRGVQKKPTITAKKPAPKIQSDKSRDAMGEVNIETKLHHVLDKTLKCMEDIRVQIDAGIASPDGDDDLDRRKKRSVEFASRFSRNYLYQLNRQVNDILHTTSQLDGNITNRTGYSVRQKLVASYQTMLQGLQAYYNHLPVSITNAVPDKVRELLKLTSSLCEIHRSCANTDFNSNLEKDKIIDIFEVRSKCLLEKINEKYFYPSSLSLMQANSNATETHQPRSGRRRQPKKKTVSGEKNRYAMYAGTPVRQDEAWKKACAVLAKKKFNVSSKYKTANFKHRPPVDKPASPSRQTLKGNKIVEKKSSTKIKTKSALNDDNIQTIVQWHTDKVTDSCSKSCGQPTGNTNNDVSEAKPAGEVRNADIQQDILANMIGRIVNTFKEENKEMNQQQVKNILQGFLEYVGGSSCAQELGKDQQEKAEKKASEDEQKEQKEEKELRWSDVENFDTNLLEKVVEVLQRNQESLKKAKEMYVQNAAAEDVQEKKKPDRKKSVTVTGVKNAQLICIKDEDSVTEPASSDEPKLSLELRRNQSRHSSHSSGSKSRGKSVEAVHNTSEVQIHRNSPEQRASKVKISRLPRGPLRPLKMLPKKCALDILEYKLNYLKARKGNHMYKKSATKQPWVLMGEIADKILDELIQGVGAEIQVNGVIDSIYASEFAQ